MKAFRHSLAVLLLALAGGGAAQDEAAPAPDEAREPAPAQGPAETRAVRTILVLDVHSTINPATLSYVESGLAKGRETGADLILVKMGTPGGLVTTTKDILSLFGASDAPVAVWVTPEGASATSAGAILASGAHVLVMSEGTNIGAATPVAVGGGGQEGDMRDKAVNDLVSLVQSLADARGRNAELFGEMVRSASSFEAREALRERLIDGIVSTDQELARFLDGRPVHLKGEDLILSVPSPPAFVEHGMDAGQSILDVFANPNLAYLLLLIGAALIYLELQAPGGLIAGSIGALCLVLAGVGFQILPVNFGGLGLIVLAFALFLMEIYVTSYGLLTLLGMICLVFGPLFLYRTEDAYLSLSRPVVFSASAAVLAFVGLVVFVMVRERRKIGATAFNDPVGGRAEVLEALGEDGGLHRCQVRVSGGEIWKAASRTAVKKGERREVVGKDGLVLRI